MPKAGVSPGELKAVLGDKARKVCPYVKSEDNTENIKAQHTMRKHHRLRDTKSQFKKVIYN